MFKAQAIQQQTTKVVNIIAPKILYHCNKTTYLPKMTTISPSEEDVHPPPAPTSENSTNTTATMANRDPTTLPRRPPSRRASDARSPRHPVLPNLHYCPSCLRHLLWLCAVDAAGLAKTSFCDGRRDASRAYRVMIQRQRCIYPNRHQ